MDMKLLLGISWSGIVKGRKKKKALEDRGEGAREMLSLKAFPNVVRMMKGIWYACMIVQVGTRQSGSFLVNVLFQISDAAWESFLDKKVVCSANLEYMIQKTIQNIHWERRPRTKTAEDNEEDEWDRLHDAGAQQPLGDDEDDAQFPAADVQQRQWV